MVIRQDEQTTQAIAVDKDLHLYRWHTRSHDVGKCLRHLLGDSIGTFGPDFLQVDPRAGPRNEDGKLCPHGQKRAIRVCDRLQLRMPL